MTISWLFRSFKQSNYRDVSQHPAFEFISPFRGQAPIGNCDFSGAVDRFNGNDEPDFSNSSKRHFVQSSMIPVDEEVFEWIDIIDSAVHHSHEFVFVELGAGYGRWSARAYKIAKMLGISDSNIHLITV